MFAPSGSDEIVRSTYNYISVFCVRTRIRVSMIVLTFIVWLPNWLWFRQESCVNMKLKLCKGKTCMQNNFACALLLFVIYLQHLFEAIHESTNWKFYSFSWREHWVLQYFQGRLDDDWNIQWEQIGREHLSTNLFNLLCESQIWF